MFAPIDVRALSRRASRDETWGSRQNPAVPPLMFASPAPPTTLRLGTHLYLMLLPFPENSSQVSLNFSSQQVWMASSNVVTRQLLPSLPISAAATSFEIQAQITARCRPQLRVPMLNSPGGTMFCKLHRIEHIANLLIANYKPKFGKRHIQFPQYVCLSASSCV